MFNSNMPKELIKDGPLWLDEAIELTYRLFSPRHARHAGKNWLRE
jgi:hypothetical protein